MHKRLTHGIFKREMLGRESHKREKYDGDRKGIRKLVKDSRKDGGRRDYRRK